MERKTTSSRWILPALTVFTALWSILSVILMLSRRERGDYGYTGAVDYTIRMILVILCAVLFLAALVRIARFCLKGGSAADAAAAAFRRLDLGLLCAIFIEGISLYREFQNSARLLEDAIFLFMTIAAAVAMLIGIAGAGSRKRMLGACITACVFLAFAVVLSVTVFRTNTSRTLDLMYYAHRIGYLLPFVTAAAAAGAIEPGSADAVPREDPPAA